jgi:hypothetical protein
VHTVIPLDLAAVYFVGPHLPRDGALAGVRRALVWPLVKLSVAQEWGMYAPNAPRSHAYTRAWAIDADGTERALEENAIEADGWTTTWGLARTRFDIWRHHVGHIKTGEPSAARKWYAVALCIREARRGELPRRIRLESARRRANPPAAVAEGKPPLQKLQVKTVLDLSCRGPQPMRYVAIDRRVNSPSDARPGVVPPERPR